MQAEHLRGCGMVSLSLDDSLEHEIPPETIQCLAAGKAIEYSGGFWGNGSRRQVAHMDIRPLAQDYGAFNYIC